MLCIIRKNIFILSLTLLFLVAVRGRSYAALSMSQVRNQFEQETGGRWEDATSEDRKSFLREILGYEETEEPEFKEEKKHNISDGKIDQSRNTPKKKKEKASYAVRLSFRAKTGTKWEQASEEEQRIFLESYTLSEQRYTDRKQLLLQRKKDYEQEKIRERNEKKEVLQAREQKSAEAEALKLSNIRERRAKSKEKAAKVSEKLKASHD